MVERETEIGTKIDKIMRERETKRERDNVSRVP